MFSENSEDVWRNAVINNPTGSTNPASNSSSIVKIKEAEMKSLQTEALQRNKAMTQMNENNARLKAAQLRKQASDQRLAQNNRRLEVRKEEAATRLAIQNKKTEAVGDRISKQVTSQFKLPTKVNTPISSNNQTRINK